MNIFASKNYYERLNVERNATRDEIVRAFRELASVYHPDRTASFTGMTKDRLIEYDEIFQLVTEAYNTLIDADKRRNYDKTLPKDYGTWETPKIAAGDLRAQLKAAGELKRNTVRMNMDIEGLRQAALEPHAMKFALPYQATEVISQKLDELNENVPRALGSFAGRAVVGALRAAFAVLNIARCHKRQR